MDESGIVKNEKQNRRKPPLSRLRISCQVLAGAVGGSAMLASLFACVAVADFFQDYAGLGVIILLKPVFPLIYVLGLAVGVYLAGNIGKQTGSFFATLGFAFFGGLAAFFLFLILIRAGTIWTTDAEKGAQDLILYIGCLLLLFIPPIFPTLGFNLTRRYKKLPSS